MTDDLDLEQKVRNLEQQVEDLTKQLGTQEEMLARFMGGLGHLWAGTEALIGMVLDDKNPEQREEFENALRWYTSELWKAMHAGATDMARGNQEAAGTVGDVPGGEHAGGPDA